MRFCFSYILKLLVILFFINFIGGNMCDEHAT